MNVYAFSKSKPGDDLNKNVFVAAWFIRTISRFGENFRAPQNRLIHQLLTAKKEDIV
jgi:hypothetical protein